MAHWLCNGSSAPPPELQELAIATILGLFGATGASIVSPCRDAWLNAYASSLTSCQFCIKAYIQIKKDVKRNNYIDNVLRIEVLREMDQWDAHRITFHLRKAAEVLEQLTTESKSDVRKALPPETMWIFYFILSYPEALNQPEVDSIFARVFLEVIKRTGMAMGAEVLPALFTLQAHPNPDLRAWAVKSLSTFSKPVSLDQFQSSLSDAVASILLALTFGTQTSSQAYPFVTSPPILWSALRSVVNILNNDAVRFGMCKLQGADVRRLVCAHLGDSEDHFQGVLTTFHGLLRRLKRDMWEEGDEEYAMTTLHSILDNPTFSTLVTHTTRPNTGPAQNNWALEWLQPFVFSVIDLQPYERVLKQLAHVLCVTLQAPRYNEACRIECMTIGLRLLLSAVEQYHIDRVSLVPILEIHASEIVQAAYSTELPTPEKEEMRRVGKQLIEAVLSRDAKAIIDAYMAPYGGGLDAPIDVDASEDDVSLVICQELWQSSLSSVARIDFEGAAVLMRLYASVAFFGNSKIRSEGEHSTSKDDQSKLKSFSQRFKSIRKSMEGVLFRFSQARPDNLQSMIAGKGMANVIWQLLLQSDIDIRVSTQQMIEQAYDVISRPDSLRALVERQPGSSLDGLCSTLEEYTRLTRITHDTFDESYTIVEIVPELLDIFCGIGDGIFRNVQLRTADSRFPLNVPRLWRCLWSALCEMYQKAIEWALSASSKEVVKVFMSNVLDASDQLVESISIFEDAARGDLLSSEDSSVAGKQMLEGCRGALKAAVEWLFLRVPECLRKAVSLVCKLLDRFAKAGLSLESELKQRLVGIASRSKALRSNLSDSQIALLVVSLSAHDVEEFKHVKREDYVKKPKDVDKPVMRTPWTLPMPKPPPKLVSKTALAMQAQKQRKSNNAGLQTALQSLKEEVKRDRAGMQKPAGSTLPAVRSQPRPPSKPVMPKLDHSGPPALKITDSSDESSSEDHGDDEDTNALFTMVKQQKALENVRARQGPKRQVKMLDLPSTNKNSTINRLSREKAERAARARLAPDLTGLHQRILSWNIDHRGDAPIGENVMYRDVASVYDTAEKYQDVYEPLFMLECWEQLRSARQDASRNETITGEIVNRSKTDSFQDIYIAITPQDRKKLGLNPLDLALLEDAPESRSDGQAAAHILSMVQDISRMNSDGRIYVTFRLYLRNQSVLQILSPKSKWTCSKLFSMVSMHREYAALKGTPYYDLSPDILCGEAKPLPALRSSDIEQAKKAYRVNDPQAIAIVGAMQTQGFSLIQGPPGTGKTKTILGMVAHFLAGRKKSAAGIVRPGTEISNLGSTSLSKLLICAPSNAAVDEIVSRLKEGIYSSTGVLTKIRVVRVGAADTINAAVKDVSLDELVEAELSGMEGGDPRDKQSEQKNTVMSLRHEISLLGEELQLKRRQLEDVDNEGKRSAVEAEIMGIRQKQRDIGKRLDQAKTKQNDQTNRLDESLRHIRDKVMQGADVICSTLNGSGHEIMASIADGFETVIIDEAAQSVEVSSLIPLKYGCKRCVLVGDPNQLPPTVLSQKASSYGYNQSLFVRIQAMSPSSVHLLSIQYRMHPDISFFPSKTFYDSKLRDGPEMSTKTARPWHKTEIFGPFRFFNVSGGREQQYGGKSYFNKVEAQAAVDIYKSIRDVCRQINMTSKVGIITPYKQQLVQLKLQFREAFGTSILEAVDFNTVDGFQGQEKDIIIVSTVRGGNDGGIGFLSDVRRMNVALTRARSSLFILGNATSLKQNKHWRGLIETARDRNMYTDVDKSTFKDVRVTKQENGVRDRVVAARIESKDMSSDSDHKPIPPKQKRKRESDEGGIPKVKSKSAVNGKSFSKPVAAQHTSAPISIPSQASLSASKAIYNAEAASDVAKRAHGNAFNPKDHPMVRKKVKMTGDLSQPVPLRPVNGGKPPNKPSKAPSLFIPSRGPRR